MDASFIHNRSRDRIVQLALFIGLLAPLGCVNVDLMAWKNRLPEASEQNPVTDIVSVWEPSQGRNVDGMPTRGFAGQLFFFTRSSPTPVKVNGDVRVYVFDDQGTADEQSKPIHQFDFLGDAWTMHLQDSTLGPSYNVFIPYTREDEQLANCQLRLRLTPESGQVVYSNAVDVTLPGPPRSSNQRRALADDELSPQTVGRQLAARMRPPVETIRYGATIRYETKRPTVAMNGALPLASRRFSLASSDRLPSSTIDAGRQAADNASVESSNRHFDDQPERYQRVGYNRDANGQGITGHTSTIRDNTIRDSKGRRGAIGGNTPVIRRLGGPAEAGHPRSDALQ